MKAGVSTVPWRVWSRPRPAPDGSTGSSSKVIRSPNPQGHRESEGLEGDRSRDASCGVAQVLGDLLDQDDPPSLLLSLSQVLADPANPLEGFGHEVLSSLPLLSHPDHDEGPALIPGQ